MDKNDIYKEGIIILNESLDWAENCDCKYYTGFVAGVIGLINALTHNEEEKKKTKSEFQ